MSGTVFTFVGVNYPCPTKLIFACMPYNQPFHFYPQNKEKIILQTGWKLMRV
jgi:hypothetical protein